MKRINTYRRRIVLWTLALLTLLALSACGADATVNLNATQPQQTVTILPGFQQQMSPVPTTPPYRCGAWTSNNAPNPGATITIYARLTHDLQGVQGKAATAVVHFQSGDVSLNQTTSDQGGYVSFRVALQGRQPVNLPATIDVTFSDIAGEPLTCSAFFTPV